MLRFLLAAACCLILSDVEGQLKTRFYCHAAEGPINAVLHDLAAYSKINIEYSPSNFDTTKQVVLPAGETSLGVVLNRILSGQNVAVIERNNKIIIVAADTPLEALEKYV